ncbi:hypothetical protein CC2G_012351 [Coprinopsis cinerea AmutBmut pab1-1]|nr:hypothetical protein CC2G_012351 [Coprinopsis cinerea AmutBmut pab1-1]
MNLPLTKSPHHPSTSSTQPLRAAGTAISSRRKALSVSVNASNAPRAKPCVLTLPEPRRPLSFVVTTISVLFHFRSSGSSLLLGPSCPSSHLFYMVHVTMFSLL